MKPAETIAETIIKQLRQTGQSDLLPEVAEALQKEVFRSKVITVISAAPLSKTEAADLEKRLTKKWGEHPFVLSVDPALVSGMIIRFEGQIIDLSAKNKLGQLKTHLAQTN